MKSCAKRDTIKFTITTQNNGAFEVNVKRKMRISQLKTIFGAKCRTTSDRIAFIHNNTKLKDDVDVTTTINDGDVIKAIILNPDQSNGSTIKCLFPRFFLNDRNPKNANQEHKNDQNDTSDDAQNIMYKDADYVRNLLRANPDQVALMGQNNTRLAHALETGSLKEFTKVLTQQLDERKNKAKHLETLKRSDWFDANAQKQIANEIRKKNIQTNLEAALEYNPELFGSVQMLYIRCKVNGHRVKAFVDSGAQTTIITVKCAERCNIMRLVDTRWAGYAKGVGVQKIIGRAHLVELQIENDFLTTSFSILEGQPMDMLLGLDILRRYQCSIDLRKNMLIIGTTGTQVPFLSERKISENQNLNTKR